MGQTEAFITALTGQPSTVIDWRLIHEKDRSLQGVNLRGTYQELSATLHAYNRQGYGVFCNINALDGSGNKLDNISHIRAHVVDLDDVTTSTSNYERAVSMHPTPHFAVQTSAYKFHLYWLVDPYQGNDFYTLHQKKMAQFYGGDKSITDATRVLRVPGFYHCKGEPQLVTCWGISDNAHYSAQQIQEYFSHVNIIDVSTERHELGTPEMQAPSLEWLQYSLTMIDPNDMSYEEWMSFTAAFKQAGWSHADENTLYDMWSKWCAQYNGDDQGENLKLWRSHKNTQLGWGSIEARIPHIKALRLFGHKDLPPEEQYTHRPAQNVQQEQPFPEILDAYDCERYFKGCFLICREGKIFTPSGRFMNSTQFSSTYGGKLFILNSTGSKTTDDAWKAATRSTVYTIPKVDHVRFLPNEPALSVIADDLGRDGLNMYLPPNIVHYPGDVSIFLQHMEKILPDANDRKIYLDYMAHAIKFPGFKIQYAPMLQSAEGIGKSAFFEIIAHATGRMYVYRPRAPELVSSGSKFNAWMRGKLAIMVDEIKIDERRELIEILKPMITDSEIEVQSKGVDQEMEDNLANWFFFSNYKDAIPINKNGRRYSIFYSVLQSEQDILNAGMDKAYFDRFWSWLREDGGLEKLADWFFNYPIELGGLPVRAPKTSSYAEALKISRSPVEVVIEDAIDDNATGFRGNFVSVQAALNRIKSSGVRSATQRTVQTVLESMGFFEIGKTSQNVIQEDPTNRSLIYSRNALATPDDYMRAQGYL